MGTVTSNQGTSNEKEAGYSYDSVYLDRGTVGLLNQARQIGSAADAPGLSDDQGRESSTVAVKDLIQSDVDVATRYKKLAERHNELVDYVQSKINEQAKETP